MISQHAFRNVAVPRPDPLVVRIAEREIRNMTSQTETETGTVGSSPAEQAIPAQPATGPEVTVASAPASKSAGHVIVDTLVSHGIKRAHVVPGESFLDV